MVDKVVGIIPARYASSRFPGKPLQPLLGKPMIIWVAELSARILGPENVIVATEDSRIEEAVRSFGFRPVMTSSSALTGTDRVWEVAQQVPADIYVNIQGDEPLLDPLDIGKIIEAKKRWPEEVINGMCHLAEGEDPGNRNIPKVITTEENRLMYMSRLPVPGSKKDIPGLRFRKQVCIYAFNKEELRAFGGFGRKGRAESIEDIEILRFFELNIPVRMVETAGSSYAVDVPEDVPVVENALRQNESKRS